MPSDAPEPLNEKRLSNDKDDGTTASETPTTVLDSDDPNAVPEEEKDNEEIVVDWDGPDDPSNPRKRVVFLHPFSGVLIFSSAGRTRENGLQLPSFPHSHSCLPYHLL